jgi:Abortive infection alpha
MPDATGIITLSAAAAVVAKQAQDFIAAATGHPGESIGTILGNYTKRRQDNAHNIASRAYLTLLNIGVMAKEIPMPILVPAIEAGSLHEESAMQNIWANLLANAADPRAKCAVVPSFTTMLKDLSNREVQFLNRLYEYALEISPSCGPEGPIFQKEGMLNLYSKAGLARFENIAFVTLKDAHDHPGDIRDDYRDFNAMVGVLLRNEILKEFHVPEPIDLSKVLSRADLGRVPRSIKLETKARYTLTELGARFITACQPPKPDAAPEA